MFRYFLQSYWSGGEVAPYWKFVSRRKSYRPPSPPYGKSPKSRIWWLLTHRIRQQIETSMTRELLWAVLVFPRLRHHTHWIAGTHFSSCFFSIPSCVAPVFAQKAGTNWPSPQIRVKCVPRALGSGQIGLIWQNLFSFETKSNKPILWQWPQ